MGPSLKVPVTVTTDQMGLQEPKPDTLIGFLSEMEFNTLTRKWAGNAANMNDDDFNTWRIMLEEIVSTPYGGQHFSNYVNYDRHVDQKEAQTFFDALQGGFTEEYPTGITSLPVFIKPINAFKTVWDVTLRRKSTSRPNAAVVEVNEAGRKRSRGGKYKWFKYLGRN